jgi:phosphoglycolate phosphatase-like HAD superfamily hydrolase
MCAAKANGRGGGPGLKKLLLFDIDGTLVLTGGAGGRAMTRAFEDLYGIPNAFAGIPFNGRTDAWILSQAAANYSVSPDALDAFKPLYLEYLVVELEKPGPRKGVMPGVRELLDSLSLRDDVFIALLTGNFEQGARIKLEHFDLWRYFPCGAFGDTVHERNHLLQVALASVEGVGGLRANPADAVIIGDTPLDVGVALSGGARAIAVATGSHTTLELHTCGAHAVFEDFSDLDAVLAALQKGES